MHLLSLTTPSSIVILGVSFGAGHEGTQGELVLHPEPLFCLPTEGVSLTVVPRSPLTSTRIFYGGKDGCLYEFLYKAKVYIVCLLLLLCVVVVVVVVVCCC